ncbi:MAG: superoxide dismutase [Sphingomonadales bacterium]
MTIQLSDLPYPVDALEPFLSAETLKVHHGRHHAAYVQKTNELLGDGDNKDARDVLLDAYRDGEVALFRNAAQAWNHDHYWHSMRPGGGGSPSGLLGKELERKFGSYDAFRSLFVRKAVEVFGSGWVWLVAQRGELGVMSTKDAINPLCFGAEPLMTLDVWEHAYYIDYRNQRPRYVETFLNRLVNWEFAAGNFQQTRGKQLMSDRRWSRR